MIIFLFLLAEFVAVGAVRDCADGNNGGCSQYCIDRSDGNDPVCGCDCYYQLDGDSETCVPITPCGVDILWLNDFSFNVMNLCVLIQNNYDTGVDYTPFNDWKNTVSQYITAFSPGVENGDYVVGTMLNGRTLDVTNAYGAQTSTTTLASEISSLTKDDICGSSNVIQALYKTFDSGAANTVVLAPSGANDETTTTRVAVVGLVSPASTALDSVLDNYIYKIHEYYDQVFVYGRTDQSTLDPILAPRYEPQLRFLACNDSTSTNCPYLFYSDAVNDNGANFDSATVLPMIDTSACISRKTVNVHSVSCGINEVTITIPSCLLGGLNKADLVLNDVSCTGDTNAVLSGTDIVFTLNLDACSWALTSTTVNNIEYAKYTQTVVTKDYGVSSNVKQVSFESSCTYPRYTDEQLGIVNPAVPSLTDAVSVIGAFTVDLALYQSSSYTTAYTSGDFPVTLNVMDRIYFSVTSTLPTGLKAILKDIVVTTDTDKASSPSHSILTSQCADDTTFTLGTTTDTEVQFSVIMFEFATTGSAANGAKDPLYFHVTTYICETTDTSAACTQSCAAGRKKRDVSDADVPVEHRTIGPIYTVPKEGSKTKQDVHKKVIDRTATNLGNNKDETGVHLTTYEIYLPSPSLGVLCYWILLLASTALMFYLISKFFFKNHQNTFNAPAPWNNFGIPTAVKG
uniref:uncharacterized protein LOC120341389 n=1 Tax=Styela clava TaxID=7725 RepID=UPI00193A3B73|nr:uncharacterized protein LOC120341389 [Styela clava]XP_039265819.1 uncharacterized protein LOC120341389 [Styela clava]